MRQLALHHKRRSFARDLARAGRRLGNARPQPKRPPPRTKGSCIAILRSDAPEAEKALACKQLSVYGSSEAVPELAKLLAQRTARLVGADCAGSDSRRQRPTKRCARRPSRCKGRLLVGTINSIGVRRDAGAVELLTGRLEDKDADVASAAAVALGRIGNAAAAKSLRESLAGAPVAVRSAVAEGCVLCAERFLAEGNAAEAAKIYDEVRKAEVPRQRMLEATRGAILARGKEGIPLLVEQLRSTDKGLFQIALSTAREFPGREVDKALAAELEQRHSRAGRARHRRRWPTARRPSIWPPC